MPLPPSQPLPTEPLARLLLQWGVAPAPAQPVAERLGSWLGWSDAIQLSQALAAPARLPPTPATERRAAHDWAEAALDRLQAELCAGFEDAELAHESTAPLPERAPPLPQW